MIVLSIQLRMKRRIYGPLEISINFFAFHIIIFIIIMYSLCVCISCAHSDFNFIAILIELCCWRVWHIRLSTDSTLTLLWNAQGNKNEYHGKSWERWYENCTHMDVWGRLLSGIYGFNNLCKFWFFFHHHHLHCCNDLFLRVCFSFLLFRFSTPPSTW